MLFPDWPELAAFAYGSYLDHGRGFVLLEGKEWIYEQDPENLQTRSKIDARRVHRTYDPNTQVLIAHEAELYIQTGLSIWRPPIMHQHFQQGGWEEVLRRYRGERPATLNEELRQVVSFRWYKRRRQF